MSRSSSPVALAAGLALALAAGCGGGEPGAGAGAVTYERDVAPLIAGRCATCHVKGGIAPFELTTYPQVVAQKQAIRRAVATRYMPPWHADRACNSYHQDESLTDAQVKTILGWVDAGAPRGDPARRRPPLPPTARGLARVDLTLKMKAAYTQRTTPDEYRCFALGWPEKRTRYVTGYALRPGERRVVHHAVLFVVSKAAAADVAKAEKKDPYPGYACSGGGLGLDTVNLKGGKIAVSFLGVWAPGIRGTAFPGQSGIRIEPGATVILQMHYNSETAGRLPDRTSVDLMLADRAREGQFVAWLNPFWFGNMPIPAGKKGVTHTFAADPTTFNGGKAFDIYAAFPHMHEVGRRLRFFVDRAAGPDGCLVDVPRWDFNWQRIYELAKPVRVRPGDKLTIACTYDNTAERQPIVGGKRRPVRNLTFGLKTSDEMCAALMYTVGGGFKGIFPFLNP